MWNASVGKAGRYFFSPAVIGPDVIAAGGKGIVERRALATGLVVWRTDLDVPLAAGVGSDADTAAVVTASGDVIALDADGKPRWRVPTGTEVLSAPAVGQGLVVVRTTDSRMIAYDADTGRKRWTYTRSTQPLTLRTNAGITIEGSLIFAGFPGGRLVALNTATGVLRWEGSVAVPKGATELERVADVVGTPVVSGREVCAGAFQGRVGCFDVSSGNAIWSRDLSTATGVNIDGRFAYVTDASSNVNALTRSNGASIWKNDKMAYRRMTEPASVGRAIAVGDYKGFVHWLSREDGSLIARTPTDGSALVIAPRVVLGRQCACGAVPDAGRQPLRVRDGLAQGDDDPSSRSSGSFDRPRAAMTTGQPLPVIAIVGRPNVGKSTLFNRLTRSRDALVADMPGLTRDRHYGTGRVGERPFLVIDTGGFEPVAKEGIVHEMAKQTRQAIAEADALVFLVDGRQGLTGEDQAIADDLRRAGRPMIVAVNKAEGMRHGTVTAEFHELGLGDPVAISSAHGDGVRELIEELLERVAPLASSDEDEPAIDDGPRRIKIAIVGRPNVGKSTLVNALLGEERVIVFDQPGTTRDSIHIDFDRGGKPYTLIDTAGIRRRGKVFEAVEKFSVVKTLQAVADANVVVLVLDAHQEISDQDAHIAGFVVESGRAVVVAINKWDDLDDYGRERIKRDAARKLQFLGFAQHPPHLGVEGSGHRGVDEVGRRCRGRGVREAADAEADARADRGGRSADAAAPRPVATEASLRASRRTEPAGDRHPRQRTRPGTGDVSALPRDVLPRNFFVAGNSTSRRVPVDAQSLCGAQHEVTARRFL